MELFFHKDTPVVTIEWLNNLEFLIIHEKEQLEYILNNNPDVDRSVKGELADTWETSNGAVTVVTLNGLAYHILMITLQNSRVLIHECVHAVDEMCMTKGIPVTYENTEIRAYMTDWLYGTIYNLIWPKDPWVEDYHDW